MKTALSFSDVTYAYPSGTRALSGIDLHLHPGERVALLGPNGAGKSTLMLTSIGILPHSSGRISIGNVEVGPRTVAHVRRSVGLVFQDPDDQLFMTTVYDDVAFGPRAMGLSQAEVDARVVEALTAVGLQDEAERPGPDLSFGQRKRAALATVLSMRPSILILDEPTSNLDPRARRSMIELLASLDTTLLVATHDMDLVWDLCDRSVVLESGRVVADGSTRAVLSDEPFLLRHGLEAPAAVRYGG